MNIYYKESIPGRLTYGAIPAKGHKNWLKNNPHAVRIPKKQYIEEVEYYAFHPMNKDSKK